MGAIWHINSFDQGGVQLGKTLATDITNDLASNSDFSGHDPSTKSLLSIYEERRGL